MVEGWRLVLGDNDGVSALSIETRFDNPELPWNDEETTAYDVWKINDERVLDLKNQVEIVHNILKDAQTFYLDLRNKKYSKPDQASELRKRREALKQRVVDIPNLINAGDEQGLRTLGNNLTERLLQGIYNQIHSALLNQSDTGPVPLDLEREKEKKGCCTLEAINKRAVIESLKNS